MKRTLTRKQVMARMLKGDLPTYAGSGTGAIFDDGARVSGSVISALVKSGEVNLPKHTSTTSPFTLNEQRKPTTHNVWVSGFVTSSLHECAQEQSHDFIGNLYEFARPQLTFVSHSKANLIRATKAAGESDWLEEAKDCVEGDEPLPSVVWRDDPKPTEGEYVAYLFTVEEAAKFDKDPDEAQPEGALVVVKARQV